MKKYFIVLFLFIALLLTGCGNEEVEIKFVSNGGSEVGTITKLEDFDVGNLPIPVKAGYTFDGWYYDSEFKSKLSEDNPPKESKFTLYAKWIGISVNYKVEHYQENINDDNYTLFETENLTGFNGDTVTAVKKSYSGFSENTTHTNRKVQATLSVDGNLILKVYYQRNRYSLSFNSNGGSDVVGQSVKYGAEISTPNAPTRIGYAFDNWFLSNESTEAYSFATMPASDLTLYAKWICLNVEYKVEHYQENANDDNYTLIDTENFTALTETIVNGSVKTYFGFSENLVHPSRLVNGEVLGDGSLVLKFYYQRNHYILTFNSNGGSEVQELSVKYGANISAPTVPTRIGYDFDNWFISNESTEAYSFATMPGENISLYAKWIKIIYKITFECNAEISVTSIRAAYDDVISEPSAPILSGYNFLGWYTDTTYTTKYVFSKMPAENFTLYAKWDGLPATMYFDSRGGSIVQEITANVGTQVTPPTPTNEGYNFIGWYKEETCENAYERWIMPAGGITLYAKWEPKNYTITFITNGGSIVDPIIAPYLSIINEPIAPTKSGFVFYGWYTDNELTNEFYFESMPLDGAVLYAKWLDESLQSQIDNVLRQDVGSYVTVKGTVFSKLTTPYVGFYLLDATGYIFILSNQDLVQIGDNVTLNGYLEPTPMINGVSNLVINSSGNEITSPDVYTITEINNIEPLFINNSKYVKTNGILSYLNGFYYLTDPVDDSRLKIYHRSYNHNLSVLDDYLDDYLEIELVLSKNGYSWEAGLVEIVNVIDNDQDRLDIVEEYVMTTYNNYITRPNSDFEILNDRFGWSSISYVATGDNASLYDSFNKKFLSTTEQKIVNFDVTITVGTLEKTISIVVIVKPMTIISIYDFIHYQSSESRTIQGVVMMILFDNSFILKDSTSQIVVLESNLDIEIGDEIIITGYLDYEEGFTFIDGYDTVILEAIVNRNVNVDNIPNVLTTNEAISQMNNLTLDYATYIEVSGFVRFDEEEGIYLEIGQKHLFIYPHNFYGYVSFDGYIDLEVKIRGYIIPDYENGWLLLYMGLRGDIQIVQGTDQELVNRLQKLFIDEYTGREFHPFEKFSLEPTHPLYGGNISWQMSAESLPFFDLETSKFKFVDTDVPISIEIVITSNDASLSFVFNTTLKAFEYLKASDFQALDEGEEAIIKGLVVYHHPEYVYLLAEDGLIFVDMYTLDVFKGDMIIIKGYKSISYEGEAYLREDWESEENPVLYIVSRHNSVTIPMEEMTTSDIYQLDPEDTSSFTKYVEIEGYIRGEEWNLNIESNGLSVKLDYVDDYTQFKLFEKLDNYVTIRGYISEFDQGKWIIRYTGATDDVSLVSYSDLEKFNIVKESLTSIYESRHYDSNQTLGLLSSHRFSSYITYQAVGENADLVNIATGVIDPVDVFTYVTIHATVQIGENDYEFEFVISIYPTLIEEEPIVIDISEALMKQDGEVVTVYGQVISVSYSDSGAYFLIKDSTGYIYMDTNWTYNTNNIGDIIQVTGKLIDFRGRKEISRENTYRIIEKQSVNVEFTLKNISDVVSIDHRDQEIIGSPVSIKGKYIKDEHNNYYLTDGYDKIRVEYMYDLWSKFYSCIGYEITINGFIYGYERYYYDDLMTIVVTNYPSYNPITPKEYDNNFIVDSVGSEIVNKYNNLEFMPHSSLGLETSHSLFNNVTINYEIISGMDYAEYYNNQILFNYASQKEEIEVKVTVTSNTTSKVFYFNVYLLGFGINSLDDLFDSSVNGEIVLDGIIIHLDPMYGFYYFLINDRVYYLDGYFEEDFNGPDLEVGDGVYIIGRKSTVDGIPGLTYDIKLYHVSDDNVYSIVSVPTNIEDIYDESFNLLEISQHVLNVSGTLRFDPYIDMLYLEANGYRLYIRVPQNYEEPSFAKTNIYYIEEGNIPWMFYQIIDEDISINVLFPNKTILGGIYLVDFSGDMESIQLKEMTNYEHLVKATDKLINQYDGRVYQSGDDLDLPTSDYFHNTIFTYSVDLVDQEFVDFNLGITKLVDSEKHVMITVHPTHESGLLLQPIDHFTIEIIIRPVTKVTIREVLYGVVGDYYSVEGVIQALKQDEWLIIKDDTGTIYVEAYDFSSYGVSLGVGDKIQLIARRTTYMNENYVPILDSITDIKKISFDCGVNTITESMTYQEILDIDYLNPDNYCKYITITGNLYFTGNYYYPAYSLYDSSNEYELHIYGTDDDLFNAEMDAHVDTTVTLKGYLIGFEYIYENFDWVLICEDVVE